MTVVYWAGTEAEAFDTTTGLVATNTTSSNYDTDYSRSAIDAFGGVRCNKVGCGSVAEAWFHTRWGAANTGGVANNRSIIEFRNSSGQGVLRLLSLSTPTFSLQYWNGSSWVTIGSTMTVTLGATRVWDIQCRIDNTTGSFAAYVDGVLQVSLTGDTDVFTGSAIEYVFIQSWGATNERLQSECILADSSTLGLRLATLVPNGNGANTAWTGTFADVDESNVNDADFLSSATANQVETMTLTDLTTNAALLTPVAVINSARARNGASGPQNIQLAFRTASTDYFSSNLSGLNTTFTSGYQQIRHTNPNTSAPWTVSEINGLEIGDKSIT
jgi:hypothetical protein